MKTNSLFSDILFREESSLNIFREHLSTKPDFNSLVTVLSHQFYRGDLLITALTHSSFANEMFEARDNERLEFIGDAAIQLVVTSLLVDRYKSFPEGQLSKFRSSLVNKDALAELGYLLGLQNSLLVGEGLKNGPLAPSLIANCFEAVIGAVYLDGGFDDAKGSFANVLAEYERVVGEEFIQISRLEDFDAKSRLQEECQHRFGELPEYVVINEFAEGFEIDLRIKGKKILSHKGVSKKKIQQEIARTLVRSEFQELSHITEGV